jgi:hypothetical protein
MNKEERKDGITLCEKCHKEFHRLYGYGENTKEQFEEFKFKYTSELLQDKTIG